MSDEVIPPHLGNNRVKVICDHTGRDWDDGPIDVVNDLRRCGPRRRAVAAAWVLSATRAGGAAGPMAAVAQPWWCASVLGGLVGRAARGVAGLVGGLRRAPRDPGQHRFTACSDRRRAAAHAGRSWLASRSPRSASGSPGTCTTCSGTLVGDGGEGPGRARLVATDPAAAAAHATDIERVGAHALARRARAVDAMRALSLNEELDGARRALEAAGIRADIAGPTTVRSRRGPQRWPGWSARASPTCCATPGPDGAGSSSADGDRSSSCRGRRRRGRDRPIGRGREGGLDGLRERVRQRAAGGRRTGHRRGFRLGQNPPQRGAVIRILLAEDQAMMRGALAVLLGLEDDLEVVARWRRRRHRADRLASSPTSPCSTSRCPTSTAWMPPRSWPSGCRVPGGHRDHLLGRGSNT